MKDQLQYSGKQQDQYSSRRDLYVLGEAKLRRQLRLQGAYRLVALENLRQLAFLHAADLHHFFGPALVLHVEEQHAGGVGHVRAEGAA